MTTTVTSTTANDGVLVGAWRLLSFHLTSSKGNVVHPFGESPRGSLVYTDTGFMSAQVMRKDRPVLTSGDQLKGTADEMAANFMGCISYFGQYEVDAAKGFVLHHIDSSLFPNWEGGVQKRFFKLSGDRLELSTPPIRWGGSQNVGVLLWQRIGAGSFIGGGDF
jgi:hypothetical protein